MRASVFIGTSLDGFIARPDGTFGFLPDNPEPHGYDEFIASVRRWLDRLSTCTADRNPRLRVVALSFHVLRREGVGGFRRRAASFVRTRLPTAGVRQ